MNAHTRASSGDFFVAGGTLPASAPSYVSRPADEQLFEAALAGEFCYVLTTRQMGKSSLMVRTANRLKPQGVRTAIIDLTTMGSRAEETWYLDFLTELSDQLNVAQDVEAWWKEHEALGAVRRFSNFLRDVLLEEIGDPVVIFVDEIDFTLGLPFADDFFAAVRAVFNARAVDEKFNRLTFIFLGVASPADLIKDRTRTPFNIGRGIVLRDLDRKDAVPLQQGLESAYPGQGQVILDRIYYWTGGHPYLTQKLCREVVDQKRNGPWMEAEVDRVVSDLFLSDQTNREQNLQFVQDRVLKNPHRRELLKLYGKVRVGKPVANDEQSVSQNQLKLAGLVTTNDGYLQVHNEIYRAVFDAKWIKANTPFDYNRLITYAAVAIAVLVIGLAGYILAYNGNLPGEVEKLQLEFNQVGTPAERFDRLARLFALHGILSTANFDDAARRLFFDMQQRQDQLDLFQVRDDRLVEVIEKLYTAAVDMDNTGANDPLLEAMLTALEGKGDEAASLRDEIQNWLSARQAAHQGPSQYDQALADYDKAIQSNDYNPATHYEKARILLGLPTPVYARALDDLDKVIVAAAKVSAESNESAKVVTPTLPESPATGTAPPDTPMPLACTAADLDQFEPNDDFDSATTIGLGAKYDNLNFAQCIPSDDPKTWDNDFFKVRVKPDMWVTCRTVDLAPGTDTTLVLYDNDRNSIGQSDDVDRLVGDLSSSLTYHTTYEGWLYALVSEGFHRPANDALSTSYSFECFVDVAPTATATAPGATPVPTKLPTTGPTPAPLFTATGQAQQVPVPTPTPTPISPFKSEFVNFIQIVDAVRKIIDNNPGLVVFLADASDADYRNLREQKLVRTPTPTPSKTPVQTPGVTIMPTLPVGSDRFEPNDDFDSATTVGLGVKYDNLNFVQSTPSDDPKTWDNDYLKVRVKPDMWVECRTLDLAPGTDTTLVLYDNNRIAIARSDDVNRPAGDLSSRLSYRSTYEGWLYALVSEGFHRPVNDALSTAYSFECSLRSQSTPTPNATLTSVVPWGKALTGVGMGDPAPLTTEELKAIATSNVEAVLVLTTPDEKGTAALVNDLFSIRKDMFIVARLYFSPDFNNRTKFSPQDFVNFVAVGAQALYDSGVRYFEVNWEPNLDVEGMGWNWADGAEYGQWFIGVVDLLRKRMPDARFGFPALSPQPNVSSFLDSATAAITQADWIGAASFWQSADQPPFPMTGDNGGMYWRQYRNRFPDKLILITEFSNNSAAVSPDEKGRQYATYYQLLRNEANIGAAFAFAISWPGQDSNREGWVFNGTVTTLPATLGQLIGEIGFLDGGTKQ